MEFVCECEWVGGCMAKLFQILFSVLCSAFDGFNVLAAKLCSAHRSENTLITIVVVICTHAHYYLLCNLYSLPHYRRRIPPGEANPPENPVIVITYPITIDFSSISRAVTVTNYRSIPLYDIIII